MCPWVRLFIIIENKICIKILLNSNISDKPYSVKPDKFLLSIFFFELNDFYLLFLIFLIFLW